MNRIVAFAVVLASLALVTTASAVNGRPDSVQTATRWAHFNHLMNPPARERAVADTFAYYDRLLNQPATSSTAQAPQTDTSAVPTLRGYRDFGLTDMQPAVAGAAVRLTSQAVGGTQVAETSAVPSLTGYRDFGLGNVQPAVVQTVPTAASEPLDEFGASGFDWADAGIGAAAMLGLVLIAAGLGAGLIVRGHNRPIRSA